MIPKRTFLAMGKPVRWIRHLIHKKKGKKAIVCDTEAHTRLTEEVLETHRKRMEAICAWNAEELDLTFKRYNMELTMTFERCKEVLETSFAGISKETCSGVDCHDSPGQETACVGKSVPHPFPITSGIQLDEPEPNAHHMTNAMVAFAGVCHETPPEVECENSPIQEAASFGAKDVPKLSPTKGGLLLDAFEHDSQVITSAPSPPKPYFVERSPPQSAYPCSGPRFEDFSSSGLSTSSEECDEVAHMQNRRRFSFDGSLLRKMKHAIANWITRNTAKGKWEDEQDRQSAARREEVRERQELRDLMNQMPHHMEANYMVNKTFFAPM